MFTYRKVFFLKEIIKPVKKIKLSTITVVQVRDTNKIKIQIFYVTTKEAINRKKMCEVLLIITDGRPNKSEIICNVAASLELKIGQEIQVIHKQHLVAFQ